MILSHILSICIILSLPIKTYTTCPFNFSSATTLIPTDCYANYTTPSATTCCWYVYAAYLYSQILYSNISNSAFLPLSTTIQCTSTYASLLISNHLIHPQLLGSSSCNMSGDASRFVAGNRPCQFPTVDKIKSAVDLSPSEKVCTSKSISLDDNTNCGKCQNSVIAATFSLFDVTKSKEFVPCGMAATIGIWSGETPTVPQFRSYAVCLLQVLENVGGLSTDNLIPNATVSYTKPSKSRTIKIAVGSACAAISSVVAIVFLVLAIKKRRKSEADDDEEEEEQYAMKSPLPTEGLYIFTKSELKNATNDYSDNLLLGEGGAGKVYLGTLPSGQQVAIKRICLKKKVAEFYREVEILVKLRHKNLTTLLGYHIGKEDHVLVYEYMAGGNLARALYNGSLTWHQRVRIAVDVAEGLVYLHDLTDGAVVHRDVKPTNVLLTEDMRAKLSDFGVSRVMPLDGSHVSTELRGTMGYVDPESFSAGRVSESADVYGFGVMLLELVTGMKAVVTTPSGGAESIVQVVRGALEDGGGDWVSVVDKKLEGDLERGSVKEVFDLGRKCVRPYRNARPKMVEVLLVLKAVMLRLDSGVDVEFDDVMKSEPSTSTDDSKERLSVFSESSPYVAPVQAWTL